MLLNHIKLKHHLNGIAALFCFIVLLVAFYLQYAKALMPCRLCYLQRVIFIILTASFFAAFIQRPNKVGAILYTIINCMIIGLGIWISVHHIHIQNLPADLSPACAPNVDYLLNTFTVFETLTIIWNEAGDCANPQWDLFGLTIPHLSLIALCFLLCATVFYFFLSLNQDDSD